MLQQRTINTAADLQQSCVQKRGKKIPHTFPFEASGIPEGSGTVLLRCLIDRGSVKSDSLFCALSGDLPCHASPVSRTRLSVPTSGERWCVEGARQHSGGEALRSKVINQDHSVG